MNYIKGFDGLRAISILFVLLSHLGVQDYFNHIEFHAEKFSKLYSGTTGVQIFFTLSGFLITKIILDEKNKNGCICFKNFFVRRFLRLLPAAIIFYIIVAILMYFKLVVSSKFGLLFSIIYIYNFIPNKFYSSELGHTWSLALEEQFYLIWPFIINFLRKINLILTAIFIILLCIIIRYFLPESDINNTNGFMYSRWFIPAVAPVMIGSLTSIINHFYNNKLSFLFSKNLNYLLLSILLFCFPLYTLDILKPMTTFFQSLGISLLLLWLFYNQTNKLISFLEFKPLRYLGKISYGVYIFQGLFLGTGPGGELMIQQFPTNIILTFIVAIASYELIELKVMRFKKYFK